MNTEAPDLKVLRAEAEAGNVEAQYLMGKAYRDTDVEEALRWFRQAAGCGHAEAQFQAAMALGIMDYGVQQAREIRDWYVKAAATGHLGAMRELAAICRDGWSEEDEMGIRCRIHPRDLKQAFRLYEKLCAAGDKWSYHHCGLMLLEGRGVPKNDAEGFGYILKAACFHPNGARSQYLLADCYHRGIGVEPNPVEAYIWSTLARANDYESESNPANDARILALENELKAGKALGKAQNEARRREKLREEEKLTPEYCLAKAAKYAAQKETPAPETAEQPLLLAKLARIRGWQVGEAKDLSLTYFLDTRKITFQHGKNRQTFKARDVFPERCLSLLKMFYDAKNGHAPLEYKGCNVAADAGCNRENHSIVDDFNHEFRKLFGLETRHKAFRWLGKGKGRTLQALIDIHLE